MPPTPRPTGPGLAVQRPLAPVASFSAIATRPLFSPGRRPDLPPPPPPVAVTVAPPPPPPAALTPPGTLLGVLISPAGSAAILKLASGRSATVAEGADVEGWTVTQVSADRVMLAAGASSLEMTFPASQASAASASRPGAAPGSPTAPLRRRR